MTTTMTRSLTPRFAQRKHHAVTRAALIVAFWIVAALFAAVVHQRIDVISPVASVVIKVAAILAMAAAFIRLAAPETTLDQALLAGTAWVLLCIATEITVTTISGRPWFALLGSPANGGIRCVLLIAWILAPAVFIRSRE
jgi:uncharacterized membrane protein YGL010W